MSNKLITQLIEQLSNQWVKDRRVNEVFEINRAWCYSFGEELLEKLGENGINHDLLWFDDHMHDIENCYKNTEVYWLCSNENFQEFKNEDDEYGIFIKEKFDLWGLSNTTNLNWEAFSKIPIEYHMFVFHNGLFYDAECPNGVNNFLNLPFYKESIKNYLVQL